MPFTGFEDHFITLPEAAELTKNYRDMNPGAVRGEFFGKNHLLNILQQPNCVGVRIYYGYDTNVSKPKMVIVGVDQYENDLCSGIIAERGTMCPP